LCTDQVWQDSSFLAVNHPQVCTAGRFNFSIYILVIIRLIETEADSCIGVSTQCPQAVVITPTKELAIKIHNEARKFAQGSMVKSMVAYGGTSVNYQAAQLTKGCNILVATPGRLMDYVDKGRIAFSALKYLVLDEADRMLDIGFMPDIQRCVTSPNMPEKGSR
jgi:probable ATP-dependent RNA helicase DDX4